MSTRPEGFWSWIKSCYVVKDVPYILEGEQPGIGRNTSPVHDGVGPGHDGSVPPLSRILILIIYGSDCQSLML